MIKPLGTYILIKPKKIESVSEGGILLPSDLTAKEQAVEQTGEVIAIGPCAYVGWKGCDVEGKTPAECWGIKVGDIVEHRKYEAYNCVTEEGYRLIPDIQVLGVIE
jgi:co-chaperonin GroES (HSP10)